MKTNRLFNNAIFILALVGLVGFTANSSFSQQVKKKIVRVIEDDGKGEKVVKEYDITNNKQKFDSITRDVRKKMKIEQKKMDSLEHVLMLSIPNHLEIPPVPEMPDMPDMYIDTPDAPFIEFDGGNEFDFFAPDFEDSSTKVYYSETNLDKSGNLYKILEDLENGTFDTQKWNMKEVEKDKIKDFKTNGKGEVIVLNNRSMSPRHIRQYSYYPHRNAARNHRGGRGHRLVYIDTDSLSKENIETYTISSSGDTNEEDFDRIIMRNNTDWDGKHSICGHQAAFYSFDSDKDSTEQGISKSFTIESSDDTDEPGCEKVIVVTSDGNKHNISMKSGKDIKNEKRRIVFVDNGKTTNFEFTNPSAEDYKILEKSSLLKEDKSKLLSPASFMLLPKKDKDKYTISFKEKESGKVKVIIADDKGKTIKTDEFEHSKGKTKKEIEIKELKSGLYFIQAQLNGKTTTSKLEVKID